MRIKIEVDVEVPRFVRRALILGVPVALMGISSAAVGVPFPPASGMPIKASEMTANFDSLEARLDTLEAPKPIRTFIASNNLTPFNMDSGVYSLVPYVTPTHDDNTEFDSPVHAFKPKSDGDYLVCAGFTTYNSNGKQTELYIYKNGVREKCFAISYSDIAVGCRAVKLTATDSLQVFAKQSSGSTLAIPANSSFDWLTISALD